MNDLVKNISEVNSASDVNNSPAQKQKLTLEQKRAQLAMRLAALDDKLKDQTRKEDARKKILLGAYLLASGVDLKSLKVGEKSLSDYLSPKDRALFGMGE